MQSQLELSTSMIFTNLEFLLLLQRQKPNLMILKHLPLLALLTLSTFLTAQIQVPLDCQQLQSGVNELIVPQMIDGVETDRSVFIRLPSNYSAEQCYPLMFAFHGAGGSANQFVNNPNLTALIDAGEFIGVYPNGHANAGENGGFWNLGTEPTNADDVAFVDMIIQELSACSSLNLNRAYAMGFSNGAGMVNLLGKSTSHFQGIAPMFSQQTVSTAALTPSATLSVFQVNGEVDGLIPLEGGTSPVGEFVSAEASAVDWANHFNCTSPPVESSLTWGGTTLDSYQYSDCDSGHTVQYMIALETGHTWADPQAATQVYAEVWDFFTNHPDFANGSCEDQSLQIKVLLEGPYQSQTSSMTAHLVDQQLMPLNQPFQFFPWQYAGGESISSPAILTGDEVDWLLVELWDDNNLIAQKAAILLSDGSVVEADLSLDGLRFTVPSGEYYVAVRSRNHLAVRWQSKVSLDNPPALLDFTSGNIESGFDTMKEVSPGLFALAAGDMNASGSNTYADFNLYLNNPSGVLAYLRQDLNMDGLVTVVDFNLYKANASKLTSSSLWY